MKTPLQQLDDVVQSDWDSASDFTSYLVALAADLRDSGQHATADDLETARLVIDKAVELLKDCF